MAVRPARRCDPTPVRALRAYAHRFGVCPEFGVEVRRLDPDGANWRVQTSAGPRLASVVVVATGYSSTPHLPDWPGRDTFPDVLVHSADYRQPAPYRGRHVLVVGAGNSAAEIAVDQLAQSGPLGQLHHRHQAGTRHEILLIEPDRRPPPWLR